MSSESNKAVCRLCLSDKDLVWVFENNENAVENLKNVIFVTTGVEILEKDVISQKVCGNCCKVTMKMFEFRERSVKTDKFLKEQFAEYLKKVQMKIPNSNVTIKFGGSSKSSDVENKAKNLKQEAKSPAQPTPTLNPGGKTECPPKKIRKVHESVSEIFTTYPNIKIPSAVLSYNVCPTVCMELDAVEDYYARHNLNLDKAVQQALRLSRASKKTSSNSKQKEKHKNLIIPSGHSSPNDINKVPEDNSNEKTSNQTLFAEELSTERKVSPISIKLIDSKSTFKVVSKDGVECDQVDQDSEEIIQTNKSSNLKRRRLSSSDFTSDAELNHPTLMETLELQPKSNDVEYKCYACLSVQPSAKALKKHVQEHFRCNFCKAKFRQLERKERHESSCSVKRALISEPYVSLSRIELDSKIRAQYPALDFNKADHTTIEKSALDFNKADHTTTEKPTNSETIQETEIIELSDDDDIIEVTPSTSGVIQAVTTTAEKVFYHKVQSTFSKFLNNTSVQPNSVRLFNVPIQPKTVSTSNVSIQPQSFGSFNILIQPRTVCTSNVSVQPKTVNSSDVPVQTINSSDVPVQAKTVNSFDVPVQAKTVNSTEIPPIKLTTIISPNVTIQSQSTSSNNLLTDKIEPSANALPQLVPLMNPEQNFQYSSSAIVRPDIKIKDNSLLNQIDASGPDLKVLKELITAIPHTSCKVTLDGGVQTDIPSKNQVIKNIPAFTAQFKNLFSQLYVYKIPVSIKNGDFNVCYADTKSEAPKNMDLWSNMDVEDVQYTTTTGMNGVNTNKRLHQQITLIPKSKLRPCYSKKNNLNKEKLVNGVTTKTHQHIQNLRQSANIFTPPASRSTNNSVPIVLNQSVAQIPMHNPSTSTNNSLQSTYYTQPSTSANKPQHISTAGTNQIISRTKQHQHVSNNTNKKNLPRINNSTSVIQQTSNNGLSLQQTTNVNVLPQTTSAVLLQTSNSNVLPNTSNAIFLQNNSGLSGTNQTVVLPPTNYVQDVTNLNVPSSFNCNQQTINMSVSNSNPIMSTETPVILPSCSTLLSSNNANVDTMFLPNSSTLLNTNNASFLTQTSNANLDGLLLPSCSTLLNTTNASNTLSETRNSVLLQTTNSNVLPPQTNSSIFVQKDNTLSDTNQTIILPPINHIQGVTNVNQQNLNVSVSCSSSSPLNLTDTMMLPSCSTLSGTILQPNVNPFSENGIFAANCAQNSYSATIVTSDALTNALNSSVGASDAMHSTSAASGNVSTVTRPMIRVRNICELK